MGILLVSAGCGSAQNAGSAEPAKKADVNVSVQNTGNGANGAAERNEDKVGQVKVRATVNGKEFYGTLENNATTKAMLNRFPLKLKMLNLYGREMAYRYGEGTFPTEQLRSDHFQVGDLIYWPPRGSFVILYRQDGEVFERQQVGHIDGDFSVFNDGNDAEVTFELIQ